MSTATARADVPVTAGRPGVVVLDEVVAARGPWSTVVRAGEELTIVDLRGNQAVDCLLYAVEVPAAGSAADPAGTAATPATTRVLTRYSAAATLVAQRSTVLTTGSVLRDDEGDPLLTIVADDVGHHDTLGGACSQESNTLRYGHHTRHQHACAENFLREGARWGLGQSDLAPNLNFFMNVPVDPDGSLGIVDGLSAPGKAVVLRAETEVLVLVSNCPQINNPCNGFDPTPVRMVVTRPPAGAASPDDTAPLSDPATVHPATEHPEDPAP